MSFSNCTLVSWGFKDGPDRPIGLQLKIALPRKSPFNGPCRNPLLGSATNNRRNKGLRRASQACQQTVGFGKGRAMKVEEGGPTAPASQVDLLDLSPD